MIKSVLGQQLIESVRKHAARSPRTVYLGPLDEFGNTECVYVSHGQPSCIVGHAMWDAGLIDAGFEDDGKNGSGIDTLAENWPPLASVSDDEAEWLLTVQGEQDNGMPWQVAVDEADEKVGAYV